MTKSPRLFDYLQRRLSGHGITTEDLCEICAIRGKERSYDYINDRLRARQPWSQADQYAIMRAINEPIENLHIVFPESGIDTGNFQPHINPAQACRFFADMFGAMAEHMEQSQPTIPSANKRGARLKAL